MPAANFYWESEASIIRGERREDGISVLSNNSEWYVALAWANRGSPANVYKTAYVIVLMIV